MVRVEMCNYGSIYRPARGNPVDRVVPNIPNFLNVVAGVYDSPAGVILQKPEVYVVQGKRKRHAHPVDSRRNFKGFAKV